MSLPTHTLPGGLVTSTIAMGTARVGENLRNGTMAEAAAVALVRDAIASGITLFDTAENYGQGLGETVLGKALKGRRGDVLVATKFSPSNSTRQALLSACEGSLRRLGTTYIDIYQSHWPNPAVPIEETIGAMVELVRAGKVRTLGFSNLTSVMLGRIKDWVPKDVPISVMQQEYSLIERFVEHRCLPFCLVHGIFLLAYSPLGLGRLAGPQARAPLPALARELGVGSATLALAWLLRRPGVIPIPESTRPEGLAGNVAAALVRIDEDVFRRLDLVFAPSIEEVPAERIRVIAARAGSVYTSLAEARENRLGLSPSPAEVAKELEDGEMLKPVKIRPRPDRPGYFDLFEGQLRFWAWQMAHGADKTISAWIEPTERR